MHPHPAPGLYTPVAPHPALTPELSAFFNAVAPAGSLLPATTARAPSNPSPDKPSAAVPMLYSPHGSDVARMADLRIRQWIVQQEEAARRQSRSRLFGDPKP